MMDYKLHLGDSAEVMKSFDDESIDLTVTSPPYDNLRTYNGFTFDFETIAKQLFRVTKAGGVVVWVVGDATIEGSETGTSFRQVLYFMECGFNLHDTMIYEKNGSPYPSNTRYNQTFEFMFVLSKGSPKTFNPLKDRKNISVGKQTGSTYRQADGTLKREVPNPIKEFGSRNNIWKIDAGYGKGGDALSFLHPASFPESLARDHILSWSNANDLVFDPFLGSGTTGKMAISYRRNFLGIEISQEYLAIAERRIKQAAAQEVMFT